MGPPWAKDLMDTFDFKVWCSFPDCGSRALLIRKFIEAKGVVVDPAKINISALSIAADGYSAGSLKQTVNRVLTSRRIQQLKNRPLQVDEFLGPLSRTRPLGRRTASRASKRSSPSSKVKERKRSS